MLHLVYTCSFKPHYIDVNKNSFHSVLKGGGGRVHISITGDYSPCDWHYQYFNDMIRLETVMDLFGFVVSAGTISFFVE